MRVALLLVSALVGFLPTAGATPPTATESLTLTVEGVPRLGESFVLRVEVEPYTEPFRGAFVPRGGPGIDVLGGGVWRPDLQVGERGAHAWRLVARQEGFWHVGLAREEDSFASRGAVYGFSSSSEGVATTYRPHVFEPMTLDHATFGTPLNATHVRFVLAAELDARWASFAWLSVGFEEATPHAPPAAARAPAFSIEKDVELHPGGQIVLPSFVAARVRSGDVDGTSDATLQTVAWRCHLTLFERAGDEVHAHHHHGCDQAPLTLPWARDPTGAARPLPPGALARSETPLAAWVALAALLIASRTR